MCSWEIGAVASAFPRDNTARETKIFIVSSGSAGTRVDALTPAKRSGKKAYPRLDSGSTTILFRLRRPQNSSLIVIFFIYLFFFKYDHHCIAPEHPRMEFFHIFFHTSARVFLCVRVLLYMRVPKELVRHHVVDEGDTGAAGFVGCAYEHPRPQCYDQIPNKWIKKKITTQYYIHTHEYRINV